MMMQTGFFDWQFRFRQLDEGGDPLPKLQKFVKWEQFRPLLEVVRDKERKSNAGRKPFDLVLMFKVLILQSLYNLSDDQTATSGTKYQEELLTMDTRKGGHRYCPNCKKVVETRVLLEGYSQVPVGDVLAKRRQVVCATDSKGSGGCGTKWFTLEIPEDQVLGQVGKRG